MRGSVRGYVVRADTGAPVADAAITIVRGPGPAPDIAPLTDRNGSFALDQLIEGDWHLRAQGPRDEIGEEVVTVFDNSLTDVTIRVKVGKGNPSERWVSVSGQVVRADNGAPVRDALITIIAGPTNAALPEPIVSTDSNGRFTYPLVPGAWQVQARAPSGEIGQARISVSHDSPADITIRITNREDNPNKCRGLVRGQVVRADTGAPVPDAAITIVRAPRFTDEPGMHTDAALISSPTIMRKTDGEGRFVVSELMAGDWRLEVRSSEGHLGEEIVTVFDDSPTDVTIKLTIDNGNPAKQHGGIRGRVVQADTGAPVRGATISVVKGTPDLRLRSDLNGSFLLDELLAGDWHLEVRSPEGQVGENVVRVERNSVTDVTITLRIENGGPAMQRGRIRGRVVRADTGAPVPDAAITIVRGPGPAPDIAPLTDRNGSFALDELIAGDWHLRAQGPRREIGEEVVRVVDNSEANVTIRVPQTKKLVRHK